MAVKMAIIGAGAVGATVAYTLIIADLVNELVLIDIDRARAEGEAMDIADGTPFAGPVKIYAGDYEDCRDALVVIFAAGANQHPGETRMELAVRNLKVIQSVVGQLLHHWNGGVLLVVTNPVDVLTYAALRFSGLPENAVIGSGTVLDTARLRYLLSRHCLVDVRNVHAYVLGEHGDSAVFLWSRAAIAGISVDEFCDWRGVPRPDRKRFGEQVRGAAAEIISRKGATFYGVSLGVRRICEAIVRDQESVLTVSGLIDGYYGITETAFSLPSIVSRRGRVKTMKPPLEASEESALCHSAGILRDVLRENGL